MTRGHSWINVYYEILVDWYYGGQVCSRLALGGGEGSTLRLLCPKGCPMSQRLWPAGGRGLTVLPKSRACRESSTGPGCRGVFACT